MDRIPEIAHILAHIEDEKLIEGFVRAILTPTEAAAVSSRWELVKRIRRGDSQRTIARELGLSLCKITRGSKELKAEDSPFEKVMERFDTMNDVQNSAEETCE